INDVIDRGVDYFAGEPLLESEKDFLGGQIMGAGAIRFWLTTLTDFIMAPVEFRAVVAFGWPVLNIEDEVAGGHPAWIDSWLESVLFLRHFPASSITQTPTKRQQIFRMDFRIRLILLDLRGSNNQRPEVGKLMLYQLSYSRSIRFGMIWEFV